ncbi:MAG: glycosyltransferase family 1 protein [Alphaproteobacteria bacterium]
MPYRILQDLSTAMLGASGIPHDTRQLFKVFCRMPSVEITGLLGEMGPGLTTKIPLRQRSGEPDYYALASFFAAISGNRPTEPRFGHIGEAIDLWIGRLRRFGMADVPVELFGDVIWRLYFVKSLSAADRPSVLSRPFKATNLNIQAVRDRLALPPFCAARLDTRGYDFLVTSDSRPIALPAGTIKLMRYYDPIPMLLPDTMGHIAPVRQHYMLTKRAARDGHFVCISQPTERELVKLFPQAAGKTATIPCTLGEFDPADARGPGLAEIARTRLSGSAPGQDRLRSADIRGLVAAARITPETRYIMGLSTLEPRKNFEGLIDAWLRLRHTHAPDLRLVIVGRPGWRYDGVLDAIRPHVGEGGLLHLQDLTVAETRALYARAACFVSPSFAEGFGYPPLEALQCGTPPVVSNIPAHRWACGDAALYCDPYDTDDIADKIRRLVFDESGPATRAALLRAAPAVLKRYSADTIAGQWDELFGRLKQDGRLPKPA